LPTLLRPIEEGAEGPNGPNGKEGGKEGKMGGRRFYDFAISGKREKDICEGKRRIARLLAAREEKKKEEARKPPGFFEGHRKARGREKTGFLILLTKARALIELARRGRKKKEKRT